MTLDYTILWYEDNHTFYRNALRRLERHFQDLGFRLNTIKEVDNSNIEKHVQNPNINLILMDFSLDRIEGDQIISALRDSDLYTEIIFYSTRGEQKIREKMKEKGVDGVYCANKDNIQEFVEKVIKISQNSLKKVQDVNSTRGLFISCAIDLETKISDMVNDYLSSDSEETKAIRMEAIQGFLEKKIDFMQKGMDSWNEINSRFLAEKSYQDLDLGQMTFYDQYLSLSKIIARIIDEMKRNNSHSKDIAKVSGIKKELNKFNDEVVSIRNSLAHIKEVIDDDGNVCVFYGRKKDRMLMLNDEMYAELRRTILRHSNNIDEIKGLLFSS